MATVYVKTTGNDTTGDGSEGNPYATPGKAAGVATTSGDIIYVQSGTYTLSTSTENVAGGPVDLAAGVKMEGYNATAGDLGTAPVIDAGARTSISICKTTGSYDKTTQFINITADGNSQASVIGFELAGAEAGQTSAWAYLCRAVDCTTRGFYLGNIAFSTAVGCGIGFYSVQTANCCMAKDCTSHGFDQATPSVQFRSFANCIADGNGGAGFYLYYTSHVTGCIAYGNTGDGFRSVFDNFTYIGCIAYGNGAYGWNCDNTGRPALLINCAGGSNTSGNTDGADIFLQYEFTTLSADPFVDAASGDFNLNATSGGGADLRADLAAIDATDLYPFRHWVSDAFGGGGGGLVNPIISAGGGLVIRGQ